MARYTGPKSKISRKYGEPIFGDTKALEKKPHPPGQHGRGRRRKKSLRLIIFKVAFLKK